MDVQIGILILTVLISQFPVLKFGYVSDDIPVFKNPPKYRNKLHKYFLWLTGSLRLKPWADHLLTMLIHLGVVLGIFLAFGKNNVSFVAALLFAVHPMGQHGSVWISGRAYSVTALFMVYALALFPRAASLYLVFICGFYTVGYLAPFALMLFHPVWILAAAANCLIWYKKFFKAVSFKASSERVNEDKTFHAGKIILMLKTIGWYFCSSILCHKVAFYHNFLQSCAGSKKNKAYKIDRYFLAGLALVVSAILLLWKLPYHLATKSLLWYLITIIPFSNLFRVQQEISERYLYIPLIGITVFTASLLSFAPVYVSALVIGYYFGRFFSCLKQWRDDFWVVECSVSEDPHAWYGWHTRALKRWAAGSYQEAIIFWTIALNLSPNEFKLLYNLAAVNKIIGRFDISKEFLDKARDNIIPGQEKQAEEIINNLLKPKKKGDKVFIIT